MTEIGRVIQNEEEYYPRYLGDKYIKGVIPIPLKTVGSDKNIIWSICPEKVFIISDGNKKQVDCLLGLYEGKFSNGCEALVGYNLIN